MCMQLDTALHSYCLRMHHAKVELLRQIEDRTDIKPFDEYEHGQQEVAVNIEYAARNQCIPI